MVTMVGSSFLLFFCSDMIIYYTKFISIQGGSQKLLLATKESIVSSTPVVFFLDHL